MFSRALINSRTKLWKPSLRVFSTTEVDSKVSHAIETSLKEVACHEIEQKYFQDDYLFKEVINFSKFGLDSLDVMQLTVACQDSLDVELPAEVFVNLKTFKALKRHLEQACEKS
ncbi:unnamed protein product [Moneuplotes crassus]|uniref:Carrier domain-containing protein n=1 Tax=Euplotes crassus TaxID=5936 RepID=A0AAD1XW61_EUPCR|nr:unnamed protein product [Moneuplotes crassus]